MTMVLLYVFGAIMFAMILALLTWGAAQAGAGREFARLGYENRLDITQALHREFLEQIDRRLAGTS